MDTAGSHEPKKYIRTYEGDMETLKKGGTPNLTPLEDAHKAAPVPTPQTPDVVITEKPVAPAPTPATPPPPEPKPAPPPPEPKPVPPPPPPPAPKPAAPPEPKPQPPQPAEPRIILPPIMRSTPPPPPAPVPPPPKEKEIVNPLKTYAGDFRDRVKETNASTATILAAEQNAKKGAPVVSPHIPPHYSTPLVAGGVVLLLAAGIGAYAAYSHYAKVNGPVAVIPSVISPIFVDDREVVTGTSTVLFQAIQTSLSRPLTSGTVRLLYFTPGSTTESVFAALETTAPDILLRNIHTEGSIAGIINIGDTQSPFFILSVESYSNTFSGMLTWEPVMRRDLLTLFPPYGSASDLVVATSTTQKGTVKTVTPPTSQLAFTDDVIANHDVRIYRDIGGRSVIVYGYWNPNTLVIARDPAAFTELIQRLATARTP